MFVPEFRYGRLFTRHYMLLKLDVYYFANFLRYKELKDEKEDL